VNDLALVRGEVEIAGQGEAQVFDLGEARRRREQSTEQWVKKERVAEHFDVSTRTVYRWVRAGCPIKTLPGGSLRFQLGPLRDWLDRTGSA
jgi:hypothetical protein